MKKNVNKILLNCRNSKCQNEVNFLVQPYCNECLKNMLCSISIKDEIEYLDDQIRTLKNTKYELEKDFEKGKRFINENHKNNKILDLIPHNHPILEEFLI